MKKFNVGVIGCGWVSNGHIAAWKKVKNARVISVCDLFEDAARSIARARDEEPPVTVEEGLETTKILEEMALLIDETEKKRVNVV